MRIQFLGTVPGAARERHDVRALQIDTSLLVGLSEAPVAAGPEFTVLNTLGLRPFQTNAVSGYTITPLPARNSAGGLIYVIEREGKTFLCGNNSGYFPEETWDALAGRVIHAVSLDCVTVNITPNHQTEEDILTTRRRLYQLGCVKQAVWFYVVSADGGTERSELIERMHTRGVSVVYEGMTAEV
ncbi:MAG: hypothetical protein LBR72_02070 [Oscillospiraceae bacterium]|jgi:phosphoribosyl 1,2-cyclic phosphate phosphodiesterase|nr:hypothetical protein [Oscillospiraceae bacterium]